MLEIKLYVDYMGHVLPHGNDLQLNQDCE